MNLIKKTKIIGFAGILCWILALFLPFMSASISGYSSTSAKISDLDSHVGVLLLIVLIIALVLGIFFLIKDFIVKAVPSLDALFNRLDQKYSFSCVGLALYVFVRLIIVRINTVNKMKETFGSLNSYVNYSFSIAFYLIIIGCALYTVQVLICKKDGANKISQPTFGQPMNNQSMQPTFGQPMNSQPAQPTFGQPMNNQTAQPTFGQPMNNQPAQPTFGQPMNNQPAQNQQSYNPYNNNNNGF